MVSVTTIIILKVSSLSSWKSNWKIKIEKEHIFPKWEERYLEEIYRTGSFNLSYNMKELDSDRNKISLNWVTADKYGRYFSLEELRFFDYNNAKEGHFDLGRIMENNQRKWNKRIEESKANRAFGIDYNGNKSVNRSNYRYGHETISKNAYDYIHTDQNPFLSKGKFDSSQNRFGGTASFSRIGTFDDSKNNPFSANQSTFGFKKQSSVKPSPFKTKSTGNVFNQMNNPSSNISNKFAPSISGTKSPFKKMKTPRSNKFDFSWATNPSSFSNPFSSNTNNNASKIQFGQWFEPGNRNREIANFGNQNLRGLTISSTNIFGNKTPSSWFTSVANKYKSTTPNLSKMNESSEINCRNREERVFGNSENKENISSLFNSIMSDPYGVGGQKIKNHNISFPIYESNMNQEMEDYPKMCFKSLKFGNKK